MKDLKLLSPAAAAASAYIHNIPSIRTKVDVGANNLYYALRYNDQVITADAAAAATLLLILVPSTNLSLKTAASVRPSLARSRPSVMY